MTELLSPAGGREALVAAVQNGAGRRVYGLWQLQRAQRQKLQR